MWWWTSKGRLTVLSQETLVKFDPSCTRRKRQAEARVAHAGQVSLVTPGLSLFPAPQVPAFQQVISQHKGRGSNCIWKEECPPCPVSEQSGFMFVPVFSFVSLALIYSLTCTAPWSFNWVFWFLLLLLLLLIHLTGWFYKYALQCTELWPIFEILSSSAVGEWLVYSGKLGVGLFWTSPISLCVWRCSVKMGFSYWIE